MNGLGKKQRNHNRRCRCDLDLLKGAFLKIATTQTFVSPDISCNAETIKRSIIQAASHDAQIILFCEGALSGYSKAQIQKPDEWGKFDWSAHKNELDAINTLCCERGIVAVVGGVHMPTNSVRPYNSLFVLGSNFGTTTRYDKRFLSNSEVTDWYTPGFKPLVFETEGFRFGCALCIESQFPEIFMEYEKLGADAILFASYGLPEYFQIALRAHAGLNCLWIAAATPAQEADTGPAGIIGPDGRWIAQHREIQEAAVVTTDLNKNSPEFDTALKKARPWRSKAREGGIYTAALERNSLTRNS